MTDILVSISETQRPIRESNTWRRILVLLEVSILALLLPVARVGFKHLAPAGALRSTILQIGAGVVIVATALCLFLVWRRKDFKSYGITLRGWPDGLKIAVLLCLVEIGIILPLLRLASVGHFTGYESRGQMMTLCCELPGLVLFALIIRYSQSISKYMPTALACVVLVGLWATPLALARHFDRPFGPTFITFVKSVFIAGFGEEFIFRGYVQSRLNEVLGRPFCVVGIQFGWGLFIASFLFGFVHVFNGVDFIQGRFDFQWTLGISAFVMGVIFGCLREKTGSILSGAVLHGNGDAWILIVHNLR